MHLYDYTKTIVLGCHKTMQFMLNAGVYEGSLLQFLPFIISVDVVTPDCNYYLYFDLI